MLGCVVGGLGFLLWAGMVTDLDLGSQVWFIVLSGAGLGMMLGPASTDAVNRASRLSHGEATGITQAVRNYSSSLGLAILGTLLVSVMKSQGTTSLTAQGVPHAVATREASKLAQQGRGGGCGATTAIPHFIQLDFAYATRTVLYVMAAIMAGAAVVALFGLRRGAAVAALFGLRRGLQTETMPSPAVEQSA